jgi:hypothetical protein
MHIYCTNHPGYDKANPTLVRPHLPLPHSLSGQTPNGSRSYNNRIRATTIDLSPQISLDLVFE